MVSYRFQLSDLHLGHHLVPVVPLHGFPRHSTSKTEAVCGSCSRFCSPAMLRTVTSTSSAVIAEDGGAKRGTAVGKWLGKWAEIWGTWWKM